MVVTENRILQTKSIISNLNLLNILEKSNEKEREQPYHSKAPNAIAATIYPHALPIQYSIPPRQTATATKAANQNTSVATSRSKNPILLHL